MIFIKLSLAVQLVLLSVVVMAQEAEPEDPVYNKKLQSISLSYTKIKDAKFGLKGLIKALRDKVPVLDEEGRDVTIERIIDVHKGLKTSVSEHNRKSSELKYKYPGKGELNERQYMPLRVQSLEDIEQEIGIDGVLTKLKRKVEKKYKTFDPEEDDDGGERSLRRRKAQLKAQKREKKKRLKLER